MSSPLLESLGLGGLDIGWILLVLVILAIAAMVLCILQIAKVNKLKKRLDKFTKGKEGKSLEQDILALFEDNKFIKNETEKNKKYIRELLRKTDYCYQKMGLVKYDAYKQMGGQLSFCLCLLDNRDCGFILNSVHSSDGCYSYTKEVNKGVCELALGEEEQKALDMAVGY